MCDAFAKNARKKKERKSKKCYTTKKERKRERKKERKKVRVKTCL